MHISFTILQNVQSSRFGAREVNSSMRLFAASHADYYAVIRLHLVISPELLPVNLTVTGSG
jgi:hypothetical protein